jgi:hypothetical protein
MTSAANTENTMTGRPDLAETAPLVLCPACGAEPRTHDRFCRRCGVELEGHDSISRFATSPLAPAAGDRASGKLLSSIQSAVSANLAVYPVNRAAKRIVIALISIPLWMLIVLLSPLDAYVAAKAITKQS